MLHTNNESHYSPSSSSSNKGCCCASIGHCMGWYGCFTLLALTATIVFIAMSQQPTQLVVPESTLKAMMGVSVVVMCIAAVLWCRRRRRIQYQYEYERRRMQYDAGTVIHTRERAQALGTKDTAEETQQLQQTISPTFVLNTYEQEQFKAADVDDDDEQEMQTERNPKNQQVIDPTHKMQPMTIASATTV